MDAKKLAKASTAVFGGERNLGIIVNKFELTEKEKLVISDLIDETNKKEKNNACSRACSGIRIENPSLYINPIQI